MAQCENEKKIYVPGFRITMMLQWHRTLVQRFNIEQNVK
jgi:hypothetical protein